MTKHELPIDTIGLSVRSFNALSRSGVHTVGAMMEYTEESLTQIRNLGKKSIQEILEKIEYYRSLPEGELPEGETEAVPEDTQPDFQTEEGREAVRLWLREQNKTIEELELLSAKVYNILMLSGMEQLHRLVFLEKAQLLEIPRMEETDAEELLRRIDAYLYQRKAEILEDLRKKNTGPITLADMLQMPEYQKPILEFARKNDLEIQKMSLPVRAKNCLSKSGYGFLSQILFLTQEQLMEIPAMGAGSVAQITQQLRDYLKRHEHRILAFCSGDTSVLWDDTAIAKKLLRLYAQTPFAGYSLSDFSESLKTQEQAEDISQDQLKRVIGSLIARKELEYVDFRCYRVYGKFEDYLDACDQIEERSRDMLHKRLEGITLDAIGQEYGGLSRERVRQLVKRDVAKVRGYYEMMTGKTCFDEDYYRYFYESYAFDRREASRWMGIPVAVWRYLDLMDVKQGKKDVSSAPEDPAMGVSLRLKAKNYVNRNRIFVDGMWVPRKYEELMVVAARKFCRDEMSFADFTRVYNRFLEEEEIPFDEKIYITEATAAYRKNRLVDSRFILWKQNEMLRFYDIDSRDYTELLETMNLDAYENVAYSTYKFLREYPQIMEKYDIRDQYELHNLLRKIVPEGSFHNFRCGRMPEIKFGEFDRESAILDLLLEHAPISTMDLCNLVHEEYGYDPMAVWANFLHPFSAYCHNSIYTIDHKTMPGYRMEALKRLLTEDFYYLDEVRRIYTRNFPDADPEEINPYNLKSMGFIVLSRYVVQNYSSLDAYFQDIFTREDVVDLRPLRRRYAYILVFYQKLAELKRNLEVIEFEPGQLLHFRKLERAGVTREMIRQYCDEVYAFVPEDTYFSGATLRQDGFESALFDLGFSDWFYASLLLSDSRFSWTQVYGNLMLYKGEKAITIQSLLVDRVSAHGCVDTYDLMTELTEYFGCPNVEKNDMLQILRSTQVYHDRILDRLYANSDLYYEDLEETGGF